jgi:hypothetical protein
LAQSPAWNQMNELRKWCIPSGISPRLPAP